MKLVSKIYQLCLLLNTEKDNSMEKNEHKI